MGKKYLHVSVKQCFLYCKKCGRSERALSGLFSSAYDVRTHKLEYSPRQINRQPMVYNQFKPGRSDVNDTLLFSKQRSFYLCMVSRSKRRVGIIVLQIMCFFILSLGNVLALSLAIEKSFDTADKSCLLNHQSMVNCFYYSLYVQ